jgi:hypothetical protein
MMKFGTCLRECVNVSHKYNDLDMYICILLLKSRAVSFLIFFYDNNA